MPLDSLPGTIATFTRSQIKAKWLRDFRFRQPTADTRPGTQPDIDASVMSDTLTPLYSDAVAVGNRVLTSTCTGSFLDALGAAQGVEREPPLGGSGSVIIAASINGTTLLEGDVLTDANGTGLRFQIAATGAYPNGSLAPVTGIDTGPGTNLPAGVVLVFSSPRPGCSPNAAIFQQADGSGLSGGRDEESDGDYSARIDLAKQEQPASGNDAEVQAVVESTPGLPVQKAFTYPGVFGAGTTAFAFTMLPASPTGSRLPNAAQVAQAAGWVQGPGQLPHDDSIFAMSLIASPVSVVLRVTWDQDAASWADAIPWPPYYAPGSTPSAIVVTGSTDALHFVLGTKSGLYTGAPVAPAAGNTIGFYQASSGTFFRKSILSVSGSGPWTIVCDGSNGNSDTTYTPQAGQRAMPWSDSLAVVGPALAAYFNQLGPGEIFASLPDPGLRQKRSPPSPSTYPSILGNKAIGAVTALQEIEDAEFVEGIPATTPVGIPGMVAYLLELSALSIFPE